MIIEIIVINDGSTDASARIAEDFAARHRNVRLISQDNQGLSAARNVGIAAATGSYLLFVDSDDYFASDVLADVVATAMRLDLQLLGFDRLDVDDADFVAQVRHSLPDGFRPTVQSGVEYVASRHHASEAWAYLYRRDYLLESGLRFEVGRFVEDILFTAECLCLADRIAHYPVDVYRYVQRSDSIMKVRSSAHNQKVIADLEHVVLSLDTLCMRWSADPRVSADFLQRMQERQQTYVFSLIARFIRSDTPLDPALSRTLQRLRATRAYPMDHFPWRDFGGGQPYRALAMSLQWGYLLWVFATLVRGAEHVRRVLESRL